MSTLKKALPLLLFLVAAFRVDPLAAQGTPYDCGGSPFTWTASTSTTIVNTSNANACRSWAITFSSTSSLNSTLTFSTSPDNSSFTNVANAQCTGATQQNCWIDGANPLPGTSNGTASFRVYAAYVRVSIVVNSGSGTGTLKVYGYKGLSASAGSGAGGGSGGGMTIAGTTNQTTVTGTCNDTAGTCVVKLPNPNVTIDPTTGSFGSPGSYSAGVGGANSGAVFVAGVTDAKAQGFTVNDTAGTSILYVMPSAAGAANQALEDSGVVTCPTLASGAPAVCHQLIWSNAYKTVDSNGSAVTQRPTINFISGTNATMTCVDNAGSTRTDCTVAATAGSAAPTFPVNAQTSTYQLLASDFTNFKTIAVASGTFTITGVASGSQPASGTGVFIINYGTGVVTFARSGQNINGAAANLTIAAGSASAPNGLFVVSDGTNYIAQPLIGSSSGGGSPGGSTGQSQYNNGGAFGGLDGFILPNRTTSPGPVASLPQTGWTPFGSAFLMDFASGLTSVRILDSGTLTLRGITRAITVPYTLIAVIDCTPNRPTNGAQACNVGISDGTKFQDIENLYQTSTSLSVRVQNWTNNTTAGTTPAGPTAQVTNQIQAFKIVNNSTNRIYSYWKDGAWVQLLSQASGTSLTETTAGVFGVSNTSNAGSDMDVRLLYWSVQ